MTYPAHLSTITETFLEVVDASAPGLIGGLYLVGSVALGDFQEHSSDVNFVAVTAERPGERASRAGESASSSSQATLHTIL